MNESTHRSSKVPNEVPGTILIPTFFLCIRFAIEVRIWDMCKYLMHRSGLGLGLLSLLILAFLATTKPSPIPTRALEFPIRFDVLLCRSPAG